MNRKCYYHPQHSLHNFCVNTECSLPLCPKCINIHLNQSVGQKHHIQSLNETVEMVRQQLDTAIEAISHNLESIQVIICFDHFQQGQYTPQNCLNEYVQIIEKYRQQAIANINQHYDEIKRQLFKELKSKYSCHFGSISQPLQQTFLQLKKSRQALQQKPIECMIKVISQQTILHVQKLLEKIDEKKDTFKLELPRLEGIDGNMIRIITGGIERILNRSLRQEERLIEKSTLRSTGKYLSELNEMERINRLQAELQSLKSAQYY